MTKIIRRLIACDFCNAEVEVEANADLPDGFHRMMLVGPPDASKPTQAFDICDACIATRLAADHK